MKASELEKLTGPALDWAVDRAEGNSFPRQQHLRSYLESLDEDGLWNTLCKYTPMPFLRRYMMSTADLIDYGVATWRWPPVSTDWAFGGPFIAREKITLLWQPSSYAGERWFACIGDAMDDETWGQHHESSPLIAAMRCYVAIKLGHFIEIPEELQRYQLHGQPHT